jgi:glycosyltransferase involved in cell wall biosynthesis
LRVAIDATPLTVPTGGIARYTAELAAALAAEYPSDEYLLVSDQIWKGGPGAVNLRPGRLPHRWIARRWWLAGLPFTLWRQRIEVFHGTDFAVPYVPLTPAVLTLHDLSPWHEDERRAVSATRIRRRTPFLLRLAAMVITPSESIRREAVEKFHLPPSRVVAVPLAAGSQFRPRPADEVAETLARLHVSRPYLLFVGTLERRKNVNGLIAAWRELRKYQPHVNLVLVGRSGESSRAAEGFSRVGEPGLTVTGALADQDVAKLMAGAAVFVYPSLYEGFGLPVLEAMQAGAPVIVSQDAALLEVSGGAAVSVRTDSTAALAGAIIELLRDSNWQAELRKRGFRRAREFSWRRTAIRTREVYVEALRRF